MLLPRTSLKMQTRKGNDISNELSLEAATAGMAAEIDKYRRAYIGAIHRPVGPCHSYNCHGLTFAARRTKIWEPAEISKILMDDDYIEIERENVLAGDIIVYYHESGDAEHSGIVVEKGDLGPRVLSKWGSAHEVVHYIGQCPYASNLVKFYRVAS